MEFDKLMKPQRASSQDYPHIASLVEKVARLSILPTLNQEGQNYFLTRIVPDLHQVFGSDNYVTYKMQSRHEIVAFAAIRDGDYITHLFVDAQCQGAGVGKALLQKLLENARGPVRLRSSINAVDFYRSQGFTATHAEESINGLLYVRMAWHNE